MYARNRLTKIIIKRLTISFVRTVKIKISEHEGGSCCDFIIIFKNSPFIVDFNMRTFLFSNLPKSLEIRNHASTFFYRPILMKICMNANISLYLFPLSFLSPSSLFHLSFLSLSLSPSLSLYISI